MASRIMHCVIAKGVCEKMGIEEDSYVLFGAIAPDISLKNDGSYVISHFVYEDSKNDIVGIDWNKFLDKYKSVMFCDMFMLGYFTHLLSDAIWAKYMQDYYRCKSERLGILNYREIKYRDFQILNSILVKRFKLVNFIDSNIQIEMDEINNEHLDFMLSEFQTDFECRGNETEFMLFEMSEITNYIDYCVEMISREVQNLKNYGNTIIIPNDYYIKRCKSNNMNTY